MDEKDSKPADGGSASGHSDTFITPSAAYIGRNDKSTHCQDATNSPEYVKESKLKRKWGEFKAVKVGEICLIIINGLLLLATIVIAVIYTCQLRQMRRSTDAATQASKTANDTLNEMKAENLATTEQFVATQRAFIYLNKFDIAGVPNPADSTRGIGSWRIAFTWSNGGDTPTKYMKQRVFSKLFHGPMPATFKLYDSKDKAYEMYVGAKADNRGSPIDIPAPDMDAVRAHTGRLYLWGWATYYDVFPGTKMHQTRFCSEITDFLQEGANNRLLTSNCDRGNCTDDECKTE
jgi:hypothetical protein